MLVFQNLFRFPEGQLVGQLVYTAVLVAAVLLIAANLQLSSKPHSSAVASEPDRESNLFYISSRYHTLSLSGSNNFRLSFRLD